MNRSQALDFPFGETTTFYPNDTVTKSDLQQAANTVLGTIYLPPNEDESGIEYGWDVISYGFNLSYSDTPGTVTTAGVLGLYALYGPTPTALLVTSLYTVPVTPVANAEGVNPGTFYPPASTYFGFPTSPVLPTLPTYSAAVAAQVNFPGFRVETDLELTLANAATGLNTRYPPTYPKVGQTITVATVQYPVRALQFRVQTAAVSSTSHQYIFPYATLRCRRTP